MNINVFKSLKISMRNHKGKRSEVQILFLLHWKALFDHPSILGKSAGDRR